MPYPPLLVFLSSPRGGPGITGLASGFCSACVLGPGPEPIEWAPLASLVLLPLSLLTNESLKFISCPCFFLLPFSEPLHWEHAGFCPPRLPCLGIPSDFFPFVKEQVAKALTFPCPHPVWALTFGKPS